MAEQNIQLAYTPSRGAKSDGRVVREPSEELILNICGQRTTALRMPLRKTIVLIHLCSLASLSTLALEGRKPMRGKEKKP